MKKYEIYFSQIHIQRQNKKIVELLDFVKKIVQQFFRGKFKRI